MRYTLVVSFFEWRTNKRYEMISYMMSDKVTVLKNEYAVHLQFENSASLSEFIQEIERESGKTDSQ